MNKFRSTVVINPSILTILLSSQRIGQSKKFLAFWELIHARQNNFTTFVDEKAIRTF
jgi:hypothetical protein